MAKTPARAATPRRMSDKQVQMMALSAIADRINFAQSAANAGITFEGKRDLYSAAGYTRVLRPKDFWDRFRRNGVARRLVTALPNATWRSGAELVENDDPDVITPFEQAWMELDERLHVWDRLRKADILAQLGRYSVVLIGAAGQLTMELPRFKSQQDVAFLRQYSERDVEVKSEDLVEDTKDPRFGQPKFYTFKRLVGFGSGARSQKVHWTRVIHIADEAIEDDLFGEPRITSVWNWLDDLEKVAASGSEAYWQRVRPLLQAKLDPGVTIEPADEVRIEQEIDKLVNGLRRWARISGVGIEEVGTTDVAAFDRPIDALISLIVAGYGIPKRILMGSERGELASAQDRSNWEQNVKDRRSQFAETQAVTPLVGRLIERGALPAPKDMAYDTRWPDVRDLDEQERLAMSKTAAETNAAQGEQVITTNEIRDRILGWDPLDEDEIDGVETEVQREPGMEAARKRLRLAKAWSAPYVRGRGVVRPPREREAIGA